MKENRCMQSQHWVRVTRPCPLTQAELLRWVTQVAGRPIKVEETDVAFLVEAGCEVTRELLLSLDGTNIRGQPLHFYAHEKRWSYEEASTWLVNKLRAQEEVAATVYPYHGQPDAWVGALEVTKTAAPEKKEVQPQVQITTPDDNTKTPEKRFPTPPPRTPSPARQWNDNKSGKGGRGYGRATSPRSGKGDSQGADYSQGTPYRDSGKGAYYAKGGGKSGKSGGGKGNVWDDEWNPGRQCWGCYANGRPADHNYKECEFSRELAKLKKTPYTKGKGSKGGKGGKGGRENPQSA